MATLAFDPQPTLGALEIGAFISILLFGIATAQVYLYFHHFPDDPRMLKSVVSAFTKSSFTMFISPAGWVYLVDSDC